MSATATVPTYAFEALPGPQTQFINCPIEDVFFGGARGGAKTWGLIGDWLDHAFTYGRDARGVIFRRTYPELGEIEDKTQLILNALGARYNFQRHEWKHPLGWRLLLRYLKRDHDAANYLGHSYTWIAVDELTQWASPQPLDQLRACLRSPRRGMELVFRATGNPGGPGHTWVKGRYIDPAPPGVPFRVALGSEHVWRIYIPSRLEDNPALLAAQPNYWRNVKLATSGNKQLERAWREGDWNIAVGAYFADLWRNEVHVLRSFPIPPGWRITRALDWGSAKPFSVGWYAESDGTEAPDGHGGVRHFAPGTFIRIGEWYGWSNDPEHPNRGKYLPAGAVARGIKHHEHGLGIADRVQDGPADASIFDNTGHESTIGEDFAREGIEWGRAIKGPGSRVRGWQAVRSRLVNARDHPTELPGLFVFENCRHLIRTLPTAPADEHNPDDIDTDSEDHILDEVRYRLTTRDFRAGRIELRS